MIELICGDCLKHLDKLQEKYSDRDIILFHLILARVMPPTRIGCQKVIISRCYRMYLKGEYLLSSFIILKAFIPSLHSFTKAPHGFAVGSITPTPDDSTAMWLSLT